MEKFLKIIFISLALLIVLNAFLKADFEIVITLGVGIFIGTLLNKKS